MVRTRIWICCLAVTGYFGIASLPAQKPQLPIRILTTKDGLPQSFISGLVQDKEGFVWIGTRNGLVRFDGIRYKYFSHTTKDTNTLSSNLIISLLRDPDNRIWIEHESSAIDCIDPATEKVERITVRPLFRLQPVKFLRRGWVAGADGSLWAIQANAGLYRYNWQQQKVTHYTRQSHGLKTDTIFGIMQDRQLRTWFVSRSYLSYYDPRTGRFTNALLPFEIMPNGNPASNIEVVAIHERENGEIMLSDGKKLAFYHPGQASFRIISLPKPAKAPVYLAQTGPDGADYFESDGIIYRFTDLQGLTATGDIGPLPYREVKSFLVDRSGLIWLGTNAAGIHQIDLSAPYFEKHPTVQAFHYDVLKQELRIFTDRFSGWPLASKRFGLSGYFFRSAYDSSHQLWLALRDRVGYYDQVQNKLISLPPVPGISSNAIPERGIRGISFSPDGRLWVISDQNYAGYFNKKINQWVRLVDTIAFLKINPNISLLDVVADNDKLWVTTGSGDGLLCINKATGHIQQLSNKTLPNLLPTDLLLGLRADPARKDLLWIGTYEGLVCLNKISLKREVFSTDNGLPDNTIYAIQADKAGYFWLSTNKGLCRFHPVTHQVRVFRTADGLPGDEFNRFHSLQLPDGRLVFGGTDGWALFDPIRIKDDHYQPPVAFTNLQINNVLVNDVSPQGLLPAPLNNLAELLLPYSQNTLTFEFAGLEFNQPSKIRYRYQLKGYNDEWIVTANPLANYTKLPPGHYTLLVNATNSTGQWSSHIRSLPVVIKPPWWRAVWAYGLYMLLLAGLIRAYIRYRVKGERLQQEVLLKEREAEQLKTVDELKTRFYSNITHDFRTPLTLILAPAQQLKPTLQTEDQHRQVEAIERNAYQLLQLINQLLDLSKIESGSLGLNETIGSVTAIVTELLLLFNSDAQSREIELLLRNEVENEYYWFDTEKLVQIITNLLANALKFTPAGGKVQLALSAGSSTSTDENEKQNGVFITVSDTGIGISPEQLPFVFNRFYQADTESSAQTKGSGIGLSLVKELVELQGGTIEADSPGKESGWTTCFTVWLPYRTVKAIADSPGVSKSAVPVIPSYRPQPVIFPEKTHTENEDERESILLIEDNDELAAFIAGSLPAQYAISRAANGAEGLEMAFAQVPDLIISDVVMPVMDGFECCRRLKADERTNHIPVILLTAKAAFDSRITGLTQGADDYLTKPFHTRELQLRIHNLLERQRRLREKWQQEWSQPQTVKNTPDASLQIQPAKEQPVAEQHIEVQPAKDEAAPVEKPMNDLQEVFIQKLYAVVEERLDETAFGVEELATEIGMSRANLHRKLKALTGLPASDLIRNYRLKKSIHFLKQGFNSSETAYKTGFDSPAYFTKCFKEFYGTTPTDFIKNN